MKYLYYIMETLLLFIPIYRISKIKLFNTLILINKKFDDKSIAIQWCDFINSYSIYLKLLIDLRQNQKQQSKNQHIKDAIYKSKLELKY